MGTLTVGRRWSRRRRIKINITLWQELILRSIEIPVVTIQHLSMHVILAIVFATTFLLVLVNPLIDVKERA